MGSFNDSKTTLCQWGVKSNNINIFDLQTKRHFVIYFQNYLNLLFRMTKGLNEVNCVNEVHYSWYVNSVTIP